MIISDTSAISNLISIDHLFLLKRLYKQIIIPQAVYNEFSRFYSQILDYLQQENFSMIQFKSVTDQNKVYQLQQEVKLDDGESEAIILALELKTDLLLIDERHSRSVAKRLGIRITGLLGILLEGKAKGFVVEVKPLMDKLIEDSTFRISPLLYDKILELAGEIEKA